MRMQSRENEEWSGRMVKENEEDGNALLYREHEVATESGTPGRGCF
ncbi:unnamed protein product [Lathyrus oleraceus]